MKKNVYDQRRTSRQRGFVLTLELILITTILLLGSIVGIVAIRDALIKRQFNQGARDILVVDENQRVLGKVLGFDEHEAPLIPYIDRSLPPLAPDPAHRNYRALIGVRDDRFTSREPIYYEGSNCSGDPCIKASSDEASDSKGIDGIHSTGAVSYLYGLQGGPTYAVGHSEDGIRGNLYRSTPAACPINASSIQSRYVSQKVVTGSPCEPFTIHNEEADTSCLTNVDSGAAAPTAVSCEQCPVGLETQGDILDRYLADLEPRLDAALANLALIGLLPAVDVTLGDICCPVGTQLDEDDDLADSITFVALKNVFSELGLDLTENQTVVDTLALMGIEEGVIQCSASINLRAAESVIDPSGSQQNVFAGFTPPFRVNLPSNRSDVDGQWTYTAPEGEGR